MPHPPTATLPVHCGAAPCRAPLLPQVVTAWNGQAISAYALASRVLPAEQPPAPPCFPVEGCTPGTYLQAAVAAARFVKEQLWDEGAGRLRRAFCKAPSTVEGGWVVTDSSQWPLMSIDQAPAVSWVILM